MGQLSKKVRKYIVYLLVAAVISVVLYLNRDLIFEVKYLKNPELLREWIISYGQYGAIVFIGLQMLQVVVFFIPGEFIQVAGGYVFGNLYGIILSSVGILLGALITFYIARIFGEPLLRKIITQDQFEKIENLINKPKNKMILFILYLIPGIPKDILGYISGITPIKTKEFIAISTVARIPGICASVYLGSNLYDKNYLLLGIFLAVVIVLFVVIIIFKDKILNRFK